VICVVSQNTGKNSRIRDFRTRHLAKKALFYWANPVNSGKMQALDIREKKLRYQGISRAITGKMGT
jgi:hypothetical protein